MRTGLALLLLLLPAVVVLPTAQAAGDSPVIPPVGDGTDPGDAGTDTSTGPTYQDRQREAAKKLFVGAFVIAAIALVGAAVWFYWPAIVAAAEAGWAAFTGASQSATWSTAQKESAKFLMKMLEEWVKKNVGV